MTKIGHSCLACRAQQHYDCQFSNCTCAVCDQGIKDSEIMDQLRSSDMRGGDTMAQLKNEEPTKIEQKPAKGIGKIFGKPITIIGFESFMGKPSETTKPEKIVKNEETGKLETQYNMIETQEVFNIDGENINRFFLTDATADQLKKENVLNSIEKKDFLKVEVYKYDKGNSSNWYYYFKNAAAEINQEKLG
mgnify:FL=1